MFSPVLNGLAGLFLIKRQNEWKKYERDPLVLQHKQFQYLLERGKQTVYGRQSGLTQVESYEDFRRIVPLTDYAGLQSYIERMMEGEENVLWPGSVHYFAKSSGTTSSRNKYIPVTPEILENCHFRGGKDMLMLYLQNYPDSKLLSGKVIKLGGSVQTTTQGSIVGDLSGIMIDLLPFWAEMRSIPDEETALIPAWEEKLDKIVRIASQQDIRGFLGIPSWYLILLKQILDFTGKKNLLELWPRLEVFFHGGIRFEPYKKQFERLIGKPLRYMNIYNASEGFFGLQDRKDNPDFALTIDYDIFYEFIPMEHFRELNSTEVIPLAEVKTGANYAMVISSSSGLWRYIIGDTIRFTSMRPYRFQLTGRTKYYLNIVGEEVIQDNAEKALAKAAAKHGVEIIDYTVAPVFPDANGPGYHEWMIEFVQNPSDPESFAADLDAFLRQINSDYDTKRHGNISLKPLKLNLARPGLFYDWLKKKGKLGGQHKVPRLLDNRKVLEELLEMNV